LREVLIAVGIAFLTAVLQLALKAVARVPPTGKKFGKLEKEDFLFWTDWTVAGSVALAVLLIAASLNEKPVTFSQQILGLIYIVLGYFVLPQLVRALVYSSHGTFEAGWWRIPSVNAVAFVSLLLAVSVGAKVYG
jgi:hypothetical protein